MRLLAFALLFVLSTVAAQAQVSQVPTLNQSINITTGLTYQAVTVAGQNMRSITIQNNNVNGDACYIEVSGLVAVGSTTATSVTPPGRAAITAIKASVLLGQGQSYSRYYPFLPTGPIVATCTTTGDALYVDLQ